MKATDLIGSNILKRFNLDFWENDLTDVLIAPLGYLFDGIILQDFTGEPLIRSDVQICI